MNLLGIGLILFGILTIIAAFIISDRMLSKILAITFALVLISFGVISLIPSRKYNVTVHFLDSDTYQTYENVEVIEKYNTISLKFDNGDIVYLSNVNITKRAV